MPFINEAAVLDRHFSAAFSLGGSDATLADFTVVALLVYAAQTGMPLASYAHGRLTLARPARWD